MAPEPLHPILWQGRQWAVTTYGIEALDGSYPIEASRLDEERGKGQPDWPLHMAEKVWVDIDDFWTAFFVALALHGYNRAFDPAKILTGYRKTAKQAVT